MAEDWPAPAQADVDDVMRLLGCEVAVGCHNPDCVCHTGPDECSQHGPNIGTWTEYGCRYAVGVVTGQGAAELSDLHHRLRAAEARAEQGDAAAARGQHIHDRWKAAYGKLHRKWLNRRDEVTRLKAERDRLRVGIEALADTLWRTSACGCGHRADLHALDDAICTGGLGLCRCNRSFVSIGQDRLRALLATADADAQDESGSFADRWNRWASHATAVQLGSVFGRDADAQDEGVHRG